MTALQPPNRGSRRPSLMPTAAATTDDDHGFSVSILSAASGSPEPRTTPPRRAAPGGQRARHSDWLGWMLGVALVAGGLLVTAHWWPRPQTGGSASGHTSQQPASAAHEPPPQTATVSSPPAEPQVGAAAPADPEAASPPSVQGPVANPNPFDRIATADTAALPASAAEHPATKLTKAAPPKKPPAQPTARPTTPSASPSNAVSRDRDAELVAALMANADAARDATSTPPTAAAPQASPLTAAERQRVAADLRQCQARFPDDALAREVCRSEACQATGAVGRTKSCPAPRQRAQWAPTLSGPQA